jgi:Mrp family chromosome partitioning ATPase
VIPQALTWYATKSGVGKSTHTANHAVMNAANGWRVLVVDLDSQARRVALPRLLDRGADDEGSWIVTAGLAGESAVEERWKALPATAVEAIGRGLRLFHDSSIPAGPTRRWRPHPPTITPPAARIK